MRIMKNASGKPFAKMFQLGKEAEGFLPVGWWKATLIGWGEGLPFELRPTPQEAWEQLTARYGVLVPHDDATKHTLDAQGCR